MTTPAPAAPQPAPPVAAPAPPPAAAPVDPWPLLDALSGAVAAIACHITGAIGGHEREALAALGLGAATAAAITGHLDH